ncbi:transcription-repair coupling factor [Marinitenerispora sediminis]|uniref:Transcription-repair-coupling factor n=1 Tax=Marinitenerispora sediminis TaxID=1931232 RepID=A0A368T401_9ACTN|nr:transcription-repair coupling factor [Marinitenerispora sediminis]RCV56019.1 transcription-repair coupling factor [Marinitenerispora sediminis]RCV57746.1 transcription-repair coupling factor [Marinitenerispora sediminis]RCV60993.1 transcription-repair coupling factor [Marinitenerispora sediminis]
MSLSGLLAVVADDPALTKAIETARGGHDPRLDLVAPPALRPFLVAALAVDPPVGAGRPVLAITATEREAADLTDALGSLLPPESVALFPAWETLPHERLSPRSDTVGQRLAVLRRLAHPDPGDPLTTPLRVVVAPVRSVLQPLVAGLGDLRPVRVRAGDEVALEDVVRSLVDAGYARVDLVEKRGDVAVRGGILDVFPPTEEHPLRLEFWGDTVDEIRYFRVADQRSIDEKGEGGAAPSGLFAPPCRELLLTPEVRERARALAAEHPSLAEILDKLADGTAVEGMEAFAPVLADRMELLLDYLPDGAHIVGCDPERIRTRAVELAATSREFLDASWINAASGGEAPIDLGASSYKSIAEIRSDAEALGLPWWTVTPFDPGAGADEEEDSVVVGAVAADEYRGDTERALADAKSWLHDEWRVVMVTQGHGPAERLVAMLRGAGLGAQLRVDLTEAPEPAVATVATGRIEHGFLWRATRTVVLTEADLAGQKSSTKDMRRMPSRRRGAVDPLQLKSGDYVVHEQHGVGRYIEMVSRNVQGATREYLLIEYAPSKRGQPGDRLFVPTDQLHEVTRYVGGDAPALSRMGGTDWAKAKSRARKVVREIAGDLIRLYSARQASPGHAFAPDTPWQRELEDAFPYVETPDQLAAIDEVKGDMEKPVPMDRLICGDVGYGKTEVAVRAAFKAVQDGKQVAVLVPTTLLVQQHLSTFAERYASFPVSVKPLSRFQSDAEVEATREGLRTGAVDVVIGTHRLLSSETKFRNLGLVIIDEEQRFGVEHKEALKRLRTQVDVLAMSATPIPRTLEMGLTGIREMTTILTPPEERHPVLTFVGPYDEKQIAAAIRRELMREGQVFFVHNRVASIDRVASTLSQLVPEARVAYAHGQMNEQQLEKVMVDFWEKNFDVLVSTTIVESGLDVPNANTLIVDRADTYGLSQLHQLRGRVGRGRERAYAYFLYPAEKPLTETAHERLSTVAQHTETGAGMYVAMKDLEIRGAGNILGAEQSGSIAGVGFDLYVRMVGEAVRELKGDPNALEEIETRVELPIDAHIPHGYVPGERLRLEAYKRIASVADEADITAVREELADRYGEPPQPVDNLLAVARFRVLAKSAGLTDVVLQGSQIRFAPVDLRESQQLRLRRLHPKSILKQATQTLLVPVPKSGGLGGKPLRDRELLAWCADLVTAVFEPAGRTAAGRG